MRGAAVALALAVLTGAAPRAYDSQYVLERYAAALAAAALPRVVIYSYTLSQAGPSNIEQHHRIYRSGTSVRDEILTVDGLPLAPKVVRFSRRDERYTVGRFAPRSDAYEMLFVGTAKDGHHLDYVYETTPLNRAIAAWVDRVTIDGITFLPRAVHFHTAGAVALGTGEIAFAPFGKYWMPVVADAQARVRGKPARERIVWSDYRFPKSLPPSTFHPPRPLLATPSP